MNRPASNTGEIFDLRRIRRLVELMNEHGLSEVDLQTGETRIRLRRGGDAAPATVVPSPSVAPPPAAQPDPPPEVEVSDEHIKTINSPMVGTFYASSSPDSPPLVRSGDTVQSDTTVCIVEAMKVFNEIPAEISGKIVAVLVENEEPVEFGQPLFRVNTRP